MIRHVLLAGAAASLLLGGGAQAQMTPAEKPDASPKVRTQAAPPTQARRPAASADETKPERPVAGKAKKVSYSCEGGVSLVVTYPPESQAAKRPVKIAMKDATYFVRPAGDDRWENKTIKLVFQPNGEEARIEREGKPVAEKCRTAKPGG